MPAATNGTHANGIGNGTAEPKIHLYTNHRCPYAHRAHIALQELGLEFEETIIDLDTPRPKWYLDINPRGLVPAMKYSIGDTLDEEIIYESGIVSQFLCDSFPSHLFPEPASDPKNALKRARINFFVDTWNSKIGMSMMNIMKATSDSDKEAKVGDMVAIVEKELEPLLGDAKPFFGGSQQLTFAEVMTAPFLLRWYAQGKDGEMIPTSLVEKLDALPNFSNWAKAVQANESVLGIWDERNVVESFKKKMKSMLAQQK